MMSSWSVRTFKLGINMLEKNLRPLVLCGPSGSGKSTLIKELFKEFPDTFGFSVSHTTRSPRQGEEHGKHYYFTSKEKMQQQIDQNEFLETATFSGNLYGTSKQAVEDVKIAGKICVLDIEVEELEKRLRERQTETEESLQRRLDTAKKELEYGSQVGNFDLVIVNDSFEEAYEMLRNYLVQQLGIGEKEY
ncbi:guanylate kinase isoform X3 [Prorops nasuta]|uniref:guanylate kinase isoform X3 n=1 Tax=Prorops nasuta TaxID=863751 RepID=UPI0034CD1055